MTKCKPGDVLLARFPFTHLRSTKKRPIVVVSPEDYHSRYGDIAGLALTTAVQQSPDLKLEHWQEAGLPRETWVKPNLATFSSRLVVKVIGELSQADKPRVQNALRLVVAEDFLG